jgi:histidine triad (HIT) family protein
MSTSEPTQPRTDPATDPSCLFCRIVAGQIPSTKVTENELAFAFRDINPTAPTHVLVVPKRHIANAHEVLAEHAVDVAALITTAQEVARIDGIEERGYRLVFNVGEDSGNTVPHLHLHVVGGRPMGWPPFAR